MSAVSREAWAAAVPGPDSGVWLALESAHSRRLPGRHRSSNGKMRECHLQGTNMLKIHSLLQQLLPAKKSRSSTAVE